MLACSRKIGDTGKNLYMKAILQRDINGIWRPPEKGLYDSRVDSHGTLGTSQLGIDLKLECMSNLDIESGAGDGKR